MIAMIIQVTVVFENFMANITGNWLVVHVYVAVMPSRGEFLGVFFATLHTNPLSIFFNNTIFRWVVA